VFPTEWDRKQLSAYGSRWADRYAVELAEPGDRDCPWDFDILAFIDGAVSRWGGRLDGVFSSSDYPGPMAAAAIATELGLPGPTPRSVLRASHKYYARVSGARVIAGATPAFDVIERGAPIPESLSYPCFVKPVKGTFSILSALVRSRYELEALVHGRAAEEFQTYYVHMFNRLLERYTEFDVSGSAFLCEAPLRGVQVTVEGFLRQGRSTIVGIVDSFLDDTTGSFTRFETPTKLPPDVQERMTAIASCFALALGLDQTFFNVELFYDASEDRISVIELNPRLSGQFCDLHDKTRGFHSFEQALALACGDAMVAPNVIRGVAASVPLRIAYSASVARAPSRETIQRVEDRHPGALVWSECEPGEILEVGEGIEDGRSRRYAVVNAGAETPGALDARLHEIEAELAYEFVETKRPLPPEGAGTGPLEWP
jgi:biotin carboxylase